MRHALAPGRAGRARRLERFVAERFPPSHWCAAGALAATSWGAAALVDGSRPRVDARCVAATATVVCVVLRTRVLDDLADEHLDVVAHPQRPLPRGAVTREDLRDAAVALAATEGALSLASGPAAVGSWLAVLAASLQIYRRGTVTAPVAHPVTSRLTRTLLVPLLGAHVAVATGHVPERRDLPAAGGALAALFLLGLAADRLRRRVPEVRP